MGTLLGTRRVAKLKRRLEDITSSILKNDMSFSEYYDFVVGNFKKREDELLKPVIEDLVKSDIDINTRNSIFTLCSKYFDKNDLLLFELRSGYKRFTELDSYYLRQNQDSVRRNLVGDDVKLFDIYVDSFETAPQRPSFSHFDVYVHCDDEFALTYAKALRGSNSRLSTALCEIIGREARRGEIATEILAKEKFQLQCVDVNKIDRFSEYDHIIGTAPELKVDTKTQCMFRSRRIVGGVYVNSLHTRRAELLASWSSSVSNETISFNGVFDERDFHKNGLGEYFPFTNFSSNEIPLSVFKILKRGFCD